MRRLAGWLAGKARCLACRCVSTSTSLPQAFCRRIDGGQKTDTNQGVCMASKNLSCKGWRHPSTYTMPSIVCAVFFLIITGTNGALRLEVGARVDNAADKPQGTRAADEHVSFSQFPRVRCCHPPRKAKKYINTYPNVNNSEVGRGVSRVNCFFATTPAHRFHARTPPPPDPKRYFCAASWVCVGPQVIESVSEDGQDFGVTYMGYGTEGTASITTLRQITRSPRPVAAAAAAKGLECRALYVGDGT